MALARVLMKFGSLRLCRKASNFASERKREFLDMDQRRIGQKVDRRSASAFVQVREERI
jgi:hypothetical protein